MSSPQHEPTMEEILASIRKIISEDAPEGGAPALSVEAAAPAPVMAPAEPEPDADILELTQEFVEVAPPAAVPEPMRVTEPPKPENDVIFETPAPPDEAPMSSAHSDIFSDTTRKALDDTFANIPDEPEERPAPRAVPSPAPMGGASVESVFERAVRESFEPVVAKYLSDNSAVVIERMKPLIREWMDEHFPALLEGAVRAEVERVVKARGTKR
jgi:cell pole-organizing protein PopZ